MEEQLNKILDEEYSYDPRVESRTSSEEEAVKKTVEDLGIVSEKAEEEAEKSEEKTENKPEEKTEEKAEEKGEEQVSNGEENKAEEQAATEVESKPNRLSDRTKIEIIKETLAANQEQAEINHKAENTSSDGSNSSKSSKEKEKAKP